MDLADLPLERKRTRNIYLRLLYDMEMRIEVMSSRGSIGGQLRATLCKTNCWAWKYGSWILGFVDDVAVVATAGTVIIMKLATNEEMRRISGTKNRSRANHRPENLQIIFVDEDKGYTREETSTISWSTFR